MKRAFRFIITLAIAQIGLISYAQPTIHKVWMMQTETPGHDQLFDLSNPEKMIQANRYTQKAVDKLGLKRIEPGVWYIQEERSYKVNAIDNECAQILTENLCGDFEPNYSYSSLRNNSVEFAFGNAFLREAKAIAPVEYAEVENAEITVHDMLEIFSNWCDNAMQRKLSGKEGMRLLQEQEENDESSWSWEAWGRDLQYANLSWMKKGPHALGLIIKNTDCLQAELVFANHDMVPLLETELARMGYLKQTTRNAEGMTETVYAPRGWKKHSEEYYFVLCRDQNWTDEYSLYYLMYTIDY